jgi:ubiquinone/menaquinone biosynthesis C-methylase UbiE
VNPWDFEALAAVYDCARSGYPHQIVDVLARHAHVEEGDPVAEIGAGTGRLTNLLA